MGHVPTMLISDRSVCGMHATYQKIMEIGNEIDLVLCGILAPVIHVLKESPEFCE